jgi:hypothetical protein
MQRLLTIYDLEVEAKWAGKVGEEEIKGKVRVPEVSHEAIDGLSDYEVRPELESAHCDCPRRSLTTSTPFP